MAQGRVFQARVTGNFSHLRHVAPPKGGFVARYGKFAAHSRRQKLKKLGDYKNYCYFCKLEQK